MHARPAIFSQRRVETDGPLEALGSAMWKARGKFPAPAPPYFLGKRELGKQPVTPEGKIGEGGRARLAVTNRSRGPRDAFTGATHRQAGARFSSSPAEPGLTVLLSWDLNSMSREPTWRACVSLLRLSKSLERAVRPVRVHNRVDFVSGLIRLNVYPIVQ